ncbi:MAG TPA: aminotransferase class I/II-fold pyridoxal phosphate-dependent enzyme [Ktedonobacteraceae bacterium]|nr:aminotransferase class I/II-fold pyridoxal phosphate-dependent enzyme [Ktedonobacteraceae bacterium]
MKTGKDRIYTLPTNDITNLGAFAQQAQHEAEARGICLPQPLRLHIGEPSFRTPEHITQAAIEGLRSEPLTYGPPVGWPWLRELLVEKIARVNGYRVRPENTAVTVGGTGAILSALLATVGPGDEVLIPDPHWPQYQMQLATCGATGMTYQLDPTNEWLPDLAQMERLVTPRTRMLIMNSPANPTGAVFPRQLVSELLNFARRHDLYLLSDECYDETLFEGEHTSPAALMTPEEFESGRCICVYTFSKTYAMTGWRIGYVVAGMELLKTISYVIDASYTNVSTIAQKAAVAALTGPQDCVREMCEAYKRRRNMAVNILRGYGRYFYTPHGAFYILVDARTRAGQPRSGRELARNLLRERNVTVAPGSGFGTIAENYVRVSLAGADQEIEQGLRELCAFADC